MGRSAWPAGFHVNPVVTQRHTQTSRPDITWEPEVLTSHVKSIPTRPGFQCVRQQQAAEKNTVQEKTLPLELTTSAEKKHAEREQDLVHGRPGK